MKNLTNSKLLLCLLVFPFLFSQINCSTNEVEGCTNAEATNFNADANVDDKSCSFYRDQYIGNYSVDRSCTNGMSTPSLKIVAIAADFSSVFLEIEDYAILEATADKTKLSIPLQDLVWNGDPNFQIEGSAKFEGSILKFNYQITSMALSENSCIMDAVKL